MGTAMPGPDVGESARLGDGPVATVYSGHHRGTPVALKVFPKRLDKRTMAAFNRERSTLAGLRRVTSLLPVDGVDERPGGGLVLRMELCRQSLAGLVERAGPLSAADVVVIGRAAALALAAAHRAGIPHGGLSPYNVLFRTSGEPVVSDFGLTLRHAFARDPMHAIEYLPPETLRTGVLDERTDLYGLGAVLHFALAGRSPHPGRLGEQPGERVLRILREPVPDFNAEGVPDALATLVARLLAPDPAHRPHDAVQVAAQLGDLLPESPSVSDVDEFDDFAAQPPPAVREQPLPARPLPAAPAPAPVPAHVDEFDDFAGSSLMPPVGGGSAPSNVEPRSTLAAPHPLPRPAPAVPRPMPAPHRPAPAPHRPMPATPRVRPSGRTRRYGLVVGGSLLLSTLVLGLLALVLFSPLGGGPEELSSTTTRAPEISGGGIGKARVELAMPTDRTDHVELAWRSTRELDFAVVVAVDGGPTTVVRAGRNRTMTVQVEPGRRYCFMVQATDGVQVYESTPVPLRGATCRR
jgi:eukaryotic-like serine/threonine-protein kinase